MTIGACGARSESYPIGSKGWELDATATIPIAKIVEAVGPGATADAVPMIAFGGGLTTFWTDRNDPERVKIVSINFPILALSTRENDTKKLDLTLIGDVGFFDNKVRFGVGYELGALEADRSRFIGVFSVGTNLFEGR